MVGFHLNATTTLGVVHIPANFLSYRILTWYLTLECPSRVNDQNEIDQVPIIIDPNAFNSSANYFKKQLTIWNCDLSHLNFSFLIGFAKLSHIHIINPTSIEMANWEYLPPLPSLIELEIRDDNGVIQNDWNGWTLKLPPLTKGLETFICYGGVDDEAADRLVQWLLNSSATTLQLLDMFQTKLTRIPPEISNFENLIQKLRITCKDSEIKVLMENSINFVNAPPSEIQISYCGTGELMPGAIQGRYRLLHIAD